MKFIRSIVYSFSILLFFLPPYLFAQNAGNFLPGSVEPGVIGKQLSAPPIEAPTFPRAPIAAPKEQPGGLGPEAKKIKFTLNQIILDGNHVYSERELSKLYRDKLHKNISIADLQGIVQDITNYYRNNGYILTRAVLPPQHVVNGTVHIRIVEGYISAVHVQGTPKKAKCMLELYGQNIARSRPLQVSTMEKYLRLANELPGMSVRAVLEPSKTDPGASDMTLIANEKTMGAFISYDDYGTRYIGPQQTTGGITANSIFQSGDSTHLTMVRTAKPYELHYIDLSYEFPIGCHGLRGSIGGNSSRTFPKYVLSPLQIDGDAVDFYGILSYPVIRSREQDLTLTWAANYIDSGSDSFKTMLYDDHIRALNMGFNYNIADKYNGSNLMGGTLEHGFKLFGASSNPTSPHNSRFGADGIYTKFYGNIGRLQQIHGPMSLFLYLTGQYSWNPLLATEQFTYGGSQIGRGYDPAEILGDRGLAGSAEFRYNMTPGWKFLQSFQAYGFYDLGEIWNIKNVPSVKSKQSATSIGIGGRFSITTFLSGNVYIAQPLTKEVAALEFIGRGRKPRTFFSIVASG